MSNDDPPPVRPLDKILNDTHRSRWLLPVAGLLVFLSLALAGLAVLSAVDSNRQQAEQAQQLAEQIQQERTRAIRENCVAQNARNRTAHKFLAGLPQDDDGDQRSPEEQEKLLQGFTDAMVGPVRDCDALVARQAPAP